MELYKFEYTIKVDGFISSKLPLEETRKRAETELLLHYGEGNYEITELRLMSDEEKDKLEGELSIALSEMEEELKNTPDTLLN